MRGLVEGKGTLNLALIASYYGRWFNDEPFDIGTTTTNGLKGINVDNPKAADAVKSARCNNGTSLSNGSLMKCTPIAVWCQNLSSEQVSRAVEADTEMIHSNVRVSRNIAGYCLAIKYLLNNPTEEDRGAKVFE